MRRAAVFAVFALVCEASEARAELELELGGLIQSNVRYRPDDKSVGDWYDRVDLGPQFVRNEHIVKLRLNAFYDRFAGVIDADVVWTGFVRADELEDLSFRETVEPNRLEVHSAYIDAVDLFVEGLDLRIGQQIVAWGVADQFNPTNNLNADDLEDRLLFGVQQANLMAKLDYTVPDWFTVSGVLVPLFKPALLPSSAQVGLKATDRLPMVDEQLRWRLHAEQAFARVQKESLGSYPTIIGDTILEMPDPTWRNMQAGLRLGFVLGETDVALSYYNGFSDIPIAVGNLVVQEEAQRCDPNDPSDCVDGALLTETRLTYPRIQVAGLNVAGEIDLLGWISDEILPIGYRFELGVYFPDQYTITLEQGPIGVGGFAAQAGEYDYDADGRPGGERPVVLSDQPYAKWTLGLDYTFDEHWYMNVMWVHGLADEVGAGDWLTPGEDVREGGVVTRDGDYLLDNCASPLLDGGPSGRRCAREIVRNSIGDYLVLGLDFRWDGGLGLIRLFTIWELTGYTLSEYDLGRRERVRTHYGPTTKEGFSLVLFPEINYNFGGGFELGAGALVQLGERYTKFGDPAAGGSLIWTRARFSF